MAKDFFEDMYSVAEGRESLDQFLEQEDEGYDEEKQRRIEAQRMAAETIASFSDDSGAFDQMESDAYREANQAELDKRRAEIEKVRLEREERRRQREAEIAARKAEQEAEIERRRQEREARRQEIEARKEARRRERPAQPKGEENYVRRRMRERREGYEERRDDRELKRLQAREDRGLFMNERDRARLAASRSTTQFPDVLPIQVGRGKAFIRGSSVTLDGQATPVLSPRTALTAREWERVLSEGSGPGADKAVELLDNTVEALSSVTSSPEAQQFVDRYRNIQQQQEAVEANTSLTAGEKKQARQDLIRRKAQMAAEAGRFRDIGSMVKAQEMRDAALSEREQGAKQDAMNKMFADFGKQVNAASERQRNETGRGFSPDQRRAMFQRLHRETIDDQQTLKSLIENDGALPPEQDAGMIEDQTSGIEDADGAIALYADEEGRPMFRSTNDEFTSMPARRINNKMYPAPRNDMEVRALPKGAIYVDPENPESLALKETGPPTPAQVFEEAEEERAVKARKNLDDISASVLKKMMASWAEKQELISAATDKDGVFRGGLLGSAEKEAKATDPSVLDPFTLEGQKQFKNAIREQLVLQDIAKQAALEFETEQREQLAPYHNTKSNYEAFVSGEENDRLLVRNGSGQIFEAYTVAAKGSRFRGTPVPIFDDYEDLARSGDEIFNSAYFNPVAGRIVPINIPSGDNLGPMTDAAFNMISDTLMSAYPGLIKNSLQAKALMIRAAAHMGYDIPELAGAPATPLEEAVTGQTTPVPGQA